MLMAIHEVHVTIENKQGMSDPEGDTILNDLVLKCSHEEVTRIRTAKTLKFTINAADSDDAIARVQRICDELRIYNPVASRIALKVQR